MNKRKESIIFFVVILFLFSTPLFLKAQLNTQSGDTDVNLIVEGCNNNLICEANIGEDLATCPNDCSFIPPAEDDEEPTRDSNRPPSLRQDFFSESNLIQHLPPTNLKISIEEKNVYLFWNNPKDVNFDFIRIMKNNYYTTNPYEGSIVYEGNLESQSDYLEKFDEDYFYIFFAKYKDGNFSAPVVVSVNSRKPSIFEDIKKEVKDDIEINLEKPFEPIFFSDKLNLYEINFTQNGERIFWKKDILKAYSDIPIELSFSKKNIFAPIDNYFIEIDFFDSNDVFLRREVMKIDYIGGAETYKGNISNLSFVSRLSFKIYIAEKGEQKNVVAGIIDFSNKVEEFPTTRSFEKYILIILIMLFILFIFFKKKRKDN
ncbi:MAG: hypothetical protein WC087_02325 [Candidatus Paceibacterota bacterium]